MCIIKESLILYHVYKIPRIYNIRAVLENDVSRSLQTCQVEILSRPCKNPTVKLKYVGDTKDDATSFFTIDNILIEAVVDIFCPESKESKHAGRSSRRIQKREPLSLSTMLA